MTKERALAKVFDKVPERRGGPPRPRLHQASGERESCQSNINYIIMTITAIVLETKSSSPKLSVSVSDTEKDISQRENYSRTTEVEEEA